MKADWDRCPLCGTRNIVRTVGDVSIETRSGPIQIPGIESHYCPGCGERFFDYEASKTIDEYCLEKAAGKKR